MSYKHYTLASKIWKICIDKHSEIKKFLDKEWKEHRYTKNNEARKYVLADMMAKECIRDLEDLLEEEFDNDKNRSIEGDSSRK